MSRRLLARNQGVPHSKVYGMRRLRPRHQLLVKLSQPAAQLLFRDSRDRSSLTGTADETVSLLSIRGVWLLLLPSSTCPLRHPVFRDPARIRKTRSGTPRCCIATTPQAVWFRPEDDQLTAVPAASRRIALLALSRNQRHRSCDRQVLIMCVPWRSLRSTSRRERCSASCVCTAMRILTRRNSPSWFVPIKKDMGSAGN